MNIIKVTKQGGPIINAAYIVKSGPDIVAIECDMTSKRCEVLAESATKGSIPKIWIGGDNALHLTPGLENEETEVIFPDYKGWDIFLSQICRYTLRIVFTRKTE